MVVYLPQGNGHCHARPNFGRGRESQEDILSPENEHFEATAAVWPPPPTNAPPTGPATYDAILDFPQQSVLLLLLLTVVTLGIYSYAWLLQQGRRLNARLPGVQAAPLPFLVGVLVFAVVSALLDVLTLFSNDATLTNVSNVLDRVMWVLGLIAVFQVRNRLNLLLGSVRDGSHWFSAVWTFLFGQIYLQYKINRLRRAARLPSLGLP